MMMKFVFTLLTVLILVSSFISAKATCSRTTAISTGRFTCPNCLLSPKNKQQQQQQQQQQYVGKIAFVGCGQLLLAPTTGRTKRTGTITTTGTTDTAIMMGKRSGGDKRSVIQQHPPLSSTTSSSSSSSSNRKTTTLSTATTTTKMRIGTIMTTRLYSKTQKDSFNMDEFVDRIKGGFDYKSLFSMTNTSSVDDSTTIMNEPGPFRRATTMFSSKSSSSSSSKTDSSSPPIPSAKILENILGGGEFGTRGEIWVVSQFVVLGFIALGGDTIPLIGPIVQYFIGPSFMIIGLAVFLVGSTDLGPLLSPWTVPITSSNDNNDENNENVLVTDGMFQYVRHPLYGGLLAACIGFSLVTNSIVRLLLTGILFLVLYYKSNREEDALIDKYGMQYQTYKQNVSGKFVPKELLNDIIESLSSTTSK